MPPGEPVVAGAVADYAEITPGVGLRVIAGAEGATSFFIWRAVPAEPTLRYVVEAPGLALALTNEGTIEARDAAGTLVGIIPRPYAVDSTPDELTGSGRFTDRVSLALAPDGRTVMVAVDEGWLATATYPVYVDPTYYNAGSLSYGDAHIASGYPTQNFADYVRPDSPYYHELWLGTDPSGTSGASHDYLRWDVAPFAGTTIDTASFAIYPYHQYYDAPATTPTWLRQVIEAPNGTWRETDPTWNNRSSYSYDLWTSEACVEGSTCTFNTSTVRTIVQGWATSPAANFGIRLDEAGCGSGSDACPNTHWKRLIAAEHTGADSFKPKMTVTWHVPSATAIAKPAFTGDRTFSWTYAGSPGQTKFQVQLSSDGGATWPAGLDGGQVTSGAATWTAPDTMALADLTTYTWHVRVYDGHSWSAYSAASSFTFDAFRRGDEPFYTRVPFDLGGGWSLDVGVHSGEARLARSLFAIGAIGPPAGLELTYNSSDVAAAGAFGTGWSSNLTQHLAITGSLAIWTRADGGRVAFTLAGGTWTAVPGHTEKLTYAGSPTNEYTVTQPDQTRLVFESTGAYRLKRIVDRFGKTLALTYPTNQIVATDAVGRPTTLQLATFNGTLRVDYATDAAGRTWDLAYDATGLDLTTITESAPGGGAATPTTSLAYDTSHRLTQVGLTRDSVANKVIWKVSYDAAGKAISVVDPIAHAQYADVANTFTYGSGSTVAGLLKTYSPAVRNSTTYSFDPYGRVTTTLDPGGFTTTQAWDAAWNLASISRPITTTTSATMTYQYDGNGNATVETQDLVEGTPRTTLVTRSWYDATTNDLLVRSESDSDTATKLVTKYEYGSHGELTKVIANCTSSGITPPADASTCTGGGTQDASTNLRTDFLYDAATGLLTLEWDALGRATDEYDPLGNETAVVRNYTCSGTTPPARGQSGTGTGTVDAQTNVRASSTFAGTIPTALGLATTQTDPVGNATTYAYDNLGRRTNRDPARRHDVDPGPHPDERLRRARQRDERDRVPGPPSPPTSRRGRGRPPTRATSSAARQRSRRRRGPPRPAPSTPPGTRTQTVVGNVTTTRVFDGLGRATSETVGTAPDAVVTTRTYDAQGRELTATTAGSTTKEVYDLAGRLTTVIEDFGGLDLTAAHGYDPLGREVKIIDPAGTASRTGYDRLGRACLPHRRGLDPGRHRVGRARQRLHERPA